MSTPLASTSVSALPVAGGIALALLASLCFQLGLAIQKRFAQAQPLGDRTALSVVRAFLTSPAWLAGNGLVLCGWTLQLCALALAPLSLVMPTIAAGLLFQAVLAALWFGERLGRSERIGVGACVVGVSILALSLDTRFEETSRGMDGRRLVVCVSALVAIALASFWRERRSTRGKGVNAAIASGLVYAATGMLGKALVLLWHVEHDIARASWVVAVMIVLGIGALAMTQVAYQRGRALVVIPIICLLADFLPVAFGSVVFGEAWPHGMHAAWRVAAFVCIGSGCVALARSDRGAAERQ